MAQAICGGKEIMENNPKTGRPSTSKINANIEKVCQLVYSEHQLTIFIMADKLEIAKETAKSIFLEKLGMRKVCAKMVPLLLTPEQKACYLNVCQDILQQFEADDKISERVITGSESWIF